MIYIVEEPLAGRLRFLFHFSFGEALIKQSYAVVQLLTTDFLSNLSPLCLQQLVEVDAKFGAQQSELNISLSAVGQLVSLQGITDFEGKIFLGRGGGG